MCGNRRYLCSAADFPAKWANQPSTNQPTNVPTSDSCALLALSLRTHKCSTHQNYPPPL
jgi:hypothetical protein